MAQINPINVSSFLTLLLPFKNPSQDTCSSYPNVTALIICIPAWWPKAWRELLTKHCFEDIGLEALYVIEQPLASLFACNTTNGVIMDFGAETIGIFLALGVGLILEGLDITPIHDSLVQYPALISVPFGTRDLEQHLMEQLGQLGPNLQSKEFCQHLIQNYLISTANATRPISVQWKEEIVSLYFLSLYNLPLME